MADFPSVLAQKRKLVWRQIRQYLAASKKDLQKKTPKKYFSKIAFQQKLISEYPKRKGKYLRPTLVLLTAATMGFPEKKAIQTAAAMQLSEEWILAHDDFEDDSQERRGKPTLHRIYGRELAVNAGDALHNLTWKILKDNEKVVGPKKATLIMEEFYQMMNRTILGQTVELRFTQEGKTRLSDEDIFFIMDGKTSYYTIAGPMRLGAILAGATQSQLEALSELGKFLGRAFQIKDDLLDLTSDFNGLKKQTGNDIYEGKKTIMLAHLFRTIKGQDRKKLLVVMAKKREEKTKKEVDWVIDLMRKSGSLDYGQKLAESQAQKARTFFKEKLIFLSREPARNQIEAGIDFILKREY